MHDSPFLMYHYCVDFNYNVKFTRSVGIKSKVERPGSGWILFVGASRIGPCKLQNIRFSFKRLQSYVYTATTRTFAGSLRKSGHCAKGKYGYCHKCQLKRTACRLHWTREFSRIAGFSMPLHWHRKSRKTQQIQCNECLYIYTVTVGAPTRIDESSLIIEKR